MKNQRHFLIIISLLLSGCATDPNRADFKSDQPLIQIPVEAQQMRVMSVMIKVFRM